MAHLSEGTLLFHGGLPAHLSLILSSVRGLEPVSVLGEGVGGSTFLSFYSPEEYPPT